MKQPRLRGGGFVTLEEVSGSVNAIFWKVVKERFRQGVFRVYLADMTPMLRQLATTSLDSY